MVMVSCMQANHGECQYWGIPVSVMGMYMEREDHSWSFICAECPIIRNSKLPIYEQDERYKYMFCKDPRSCPLYTQFQSSITLEK